MHIASIEVEGVTSYEGLSRLELPPAGVVLISGHNGAGKSTWLEATSAAGWLETLRGTPVWRTGEPGTIRLRTHDGLTVVRSCSRSGAKKLDWWRGDAGADRKRWENASKAQAELLGELGPFEVWRRTAVFSAQDADTFAAAANGPRLALLERLFGLDRFAPALKAAREDRAAVERRRSGDDGELRQLRTTVDTTRQSLEDARALLAAPEEAAVDRVDVSELERQAAALREQVQDYRRRISEAEQRATAARDEKARAEASAAIEARRVQQLADGTCPTCEQVVPPARLEALRARAAATSETAKAAAAAARATVTEVQDETEELREERQSLDRKATALEERARGERQRAKDAAKLAKERREKRERAEKVLARLEEQIRTAEASLAEVSGRLEGTLRELAILEAVERVLGLQGVRTQVLGRGLAGLSQVTNGLFQIAGWEGVSITLRPFRELADGRSTREEIDLVIDGAGGGHGYRASSGGERRRVDVGLVLGLAEVGAAAHGRRAGTLWMDEVFDGLDSAGLDGIARILDAMSRDRTIVVITHRAELADRLAPAVYYHVERGRLHRRA